MGFAPHSGDAETADPDDRAGLFRSGQITACENVGGDVIELDVAVLRDENDSAILRRFTPDVLHQNPVARCDWICSVGNALIFGFAAREGAINVIVGVGILALTIPSPAGWLFRP